MTEGERRRGPCCGRGEQRGEVRVEKRTKSIKGLLKRAKAFVLFPEGSEK